MPKHNQPLLRPPLSDSTTSCSFSLLVGTEVTRHTVSGDSTRPVPLGSFSKVLLSLTMRHDEEFSRSTLPDTAPGAEQTASEVMCHSRWPARGRYNHPVYSYDDLKFRGCLEHFLTQSGCTLDHLPDLVYRTVGIRVSLDEPDRPERGLSCSHQELDKLLTLVGRIAAVQPPSPDPAAVLHLGSAVSTPTLRVGSPFFWSAQPALVLQHGGIVDRWATLLVLAPTIRCGYVLTVESSDPAAAQLALSDQLNRHLSIDLSGDDTPATPQSSPSELAARISGSYADGHHEIEVQVDAHRQVLIASRGEAETRTFQLLADDAFAEPGAPGGRRYAHAVVFEDAGDDHLRPAVAIVLDQRTFLSERSPAAVEAANGRRAIHPAGSQRS